MDKSIAYFRVTAILIVASIVGGIVFLTFVDMAPPVEDVEIVFPVSER